MGSAQSCSESRIEKQVSTGTVNHDNIIRIGMFQEIETRGTGNLMQPVNKSVMPSHKSTWMKNGSTSGYNVSASRAIASGFDFSRGRPVIPIEFDTNVNSNGVVDVSGLNAHWSKTGKKTIPNECKTSSRSNVPVQARQTKISGASPIIQSTLANAQPAGQPIILHSAPDNAGRHYSAQRGIIAQPVPTQSQKISMLQQVNTRLEPVPLQSAATTSGGYNNPNLQGGAPVYIYEPTLSHPATSSYAAPIQEPERSPVNTSEALRKQSVSTEKQDQALNTVHSPTPVDEPVKSQDAKTTASETEDVPLYLNQPETMKKYASYPQQPGTKQSFELQNKVLFLNQKLQNMQNINATRKAKNEYLLQQQASSINKLEQQLNSLLQVAANVPDQSSPATRGVVSLPQSHDNSPTRRVCKDHVGNLGQIMVRNKLVRLPDGSVQNIPVKSCKIEARAPLRPVPPEDQLEPQYFRMPESVPVHLLGERSSAERENRLLMAGPNPDHFLKGAGSRIQYNQMQLNVAPRNYSQTVPPSGERIQNWNHRMQTAQKSSNNINLAPTNNSRSVLRPM